MTLGVSPKRLSGWEPESRTAYEYDGEGRLVASVTTVEPEWDDEQLSLLLAFDLLRRDVGPDGELLSEATAPAADPNNYSGGYVYQAEGPFTNWAAKARLDAIDAWRKTAGDNANLNGLYWSVKKLEYELPESTDVLPA